MAPSTIRKAIGAVKDQTSIGIAKVSSDTAPELEVAIVKATSHDDDPAEEKHIREILTLSSYSRGYVNVCVAMVSKRLGKTRDWIVALKALILVQRLLCDGDPAFHIEILHATRRGARLLNMSDFRDEAHSSSWDHSAFVRTYALYLDQRLECMLFDRKQGSGDGESRRDRDRDRDDGDYREFNSYGDRFGRPYEQGDRDRRAPIAVTPIREMKTERVLGKMNQLLQLLDRFLACRPTGTAKNCRLVLVALYPIVKESYQIYSEISEILALLLDRFFEMDNPDCAKTFDFYVKAAKKIDELVGFYSWCKDTGVARSSEYPEVKKISDEVLETLEVFMRDRARSPKSPERRLALEPAPVGEEEQPAEDMNAIKALPAPEVYKEPEPALEKPKPVSQEPQGDLVDLRGDTFTADDQGNKFALALFAGGAAANSASDGKWEAFPSNGDVGEGNGEVTSAWQTPAAERGKQDWELALVETASNLSKQKAALAGGFDSLLLNGMYDQGAVRQHTSGQMSTVGSASSVVLPGPGKSNSQVLALPAPDGSVQAVGHQDPFQASLTVPPPAYVQMADLEKKQHLLVQEQQLWQQHRDGMQAPMGHNGFYAAKAPVMTPMPYGMPNGAGYYYSPY